jgi:hypothetical protein
MSDIVRQRSIELKDFSGGLNNYWDPSAISDNEVQHLLNMEFTTRGGLISRPPIYDNLFPPNPGSSVPPTITGHRERQNILGYYEGPNNDDTYMIVATKYKTWAIKVSLQERLLVGPWEEIWDQPASDFVQYDNKVVMCKTASSGGSRWDPIAGTKTAIASMPALAGLELFRERMFGFGSAGTAKTAVYWSDIITLDEPAGIYTWNADSFVYVGRGDGQSITAMSADYNGLIIWKEKSTYNFTYSDLPEEGIVALVQNNIGAANNECVAGYENGWVVLSDKTLYKFQNNVYAPINAQKIRFNFDYVTILGITDVIARREAVSIFGDRALIWASQNLYVLNLQTGTWAQWESTTNLGYVRQYPKIGKHNIAFGVSGVEPLKILAIEDFPMSELNSTQVTMSGFLPVLTNVDGIPDVFQCELKTKIYDFDTPTEWKRLYWWSADVAAAGEVIGRVVPIGIPDTTSTWDKLDQYTWDQLEENTWDNLFAQDLSISTTQDITGDGPQRVALKMDKSARFRRAYFELYLTCNGTEETAPAQIFSLTPMIGIKAKMSKDVA